MDRPDAVAPEFIGFAPAEGHQVYEMTSPAEFESDEGLRSLHSSFRLEVTDSGPALKRR
jgi:hypothetical protein